MLLHISGSSVTLCVGGSPDYNCTRIVLESLDWKEPVVMQNRSSSSNRSSSRQAARASRQRRSSSSSSRAHQMLLLAQMQQQGRLDSRLPALDVPL